MVVTGSENTAFAFRADEFVQSGLYRALSLLKRFSHSFLTLVEELSNQNRIRMAECCMQIQL